MKYRCHICGNEHDGLPDVGADRPDPFWIIPEDERSRRISLTSDTCQIDGSQFYVRGLIRLPIRDSDERFGIGVWVSHQEDNFRAYVQQPDSPTIGPFFGWLSNNISFYAEETLNLKAMAHFRSGGLRPRLELEPTDYPLAIDQRNGITLEKAWEIVHFYHSELVD
jgi:hypothetical protein